MTRVDVPDGVDAGLPWHYGDPVREQRRLEAGDGAVDLSNRDVISVAGPQRLSWLHSLTSQVLDTLEPGVGTTAYVLSPQGHVEHAMYGVDDGDTFWAWTEPGQGASLVAWLDSMRFMMRVEVALRPELAVVWRRGVPQGGGRHRLGADSLGGYESLVPRDDVNQVVAEAPVGVWAYEARRIEHSVPRIGHDTDARTIPNELGVPSVAVALNKGCYRGQETVARVHNLGRPPRRLVGLHLDGSLSSLPTPGAALHLASDPEGKAVGFVGLSARHHELGPIALGLVKRTTDTSADLVVEGIAAGQEMLVDPEVGVHFRAR